ncbi:MAG: membrane protein insertase YidC [Spirochaetaceae bacterium]|nr:membrane protein insertase YidC [Spirochaetaceae bacterium]
MEKNTVLFIVLSVIIFIGSYFIQMRFFPPAQPAAGTQTTEQTEVQPAVSQEETKVSNSNFSLISFEDEEEPAEEQTYTIRTNLVEVTFTNRGGDITSYKLLEHKDRNEYLQMADNITAKNRAFSIALGDYNNAAVDDIFNVKKIDDKTIGFYKKMKIKNSDGTEGVFTLVKQYTFEPDEYVFKLDVFIDGEDNMYGLNINNAGYTLMTSPQIGPYYVQKQNRYEYRSFMAYTNNKNKKQQLQPGQTKLYDKEYAWAGVGGKYFIILVVPATQSFNKAFYSTRYDSNPDYSNAQLMLTRNAFSGQKLQDSFYIYVGPRTEKTLKRYNNASDNKWNLASLHLNDSMETNSMFGWLEAILKWILEIFYKLTPNWGVAIILMTIFIKLAFFPLTKKSSIGTLKMQELQPQINEIQTKYKDKPEKLNQEMAKLYQETGYNPISGCLPLLIQFPIIIAMYNLFNNYFEFRGAMFIPGWISDLSKGDLVYTFKFNLPLGMGNELHVLPIIYVASQIVFSMVTQTSTPGQQNNQSMKIMMYGMPIFFFFILYNAPSGLILYWTLSNFLQLVQQLIINKFMKEKQAELKLVKTDKKK